MRYKILSSGNTIEADESFVESVYPNDYELIIEIVDFNLERSKKLKALNAWHDSQTSQMRAKYSQSEFESFLDKRNEAMAWRTNNTVATPYVTAMAGGNAEMRLMLLNSILAKVDATAQLEAFVLLKRDAIEACTTQTQLDAISW